MGEKCEGRRHRGRVTYEAVYHAADQIGLMDGLRATGISGPETMSVTGFDGFPQSNWNAHDLTTIERPLQEQARLGVDELVDQIESDVPTIPSRQSLEGQLKIRSAVAIRRASRRGSV